MTKKEQARKRTLEEILGFAEILNHLLVCLPTGYGKTFIALSVVERHLNDGRFLFVVPEITLIENTKTDMIKNGFEHLIKHVEFICYASLPKYKDQYFDVVILDECHRSVSDLRSDIVKSLTCNKMIALSATVSEEVREVLDEIVDWHEYKKTLKDAIEEGVLSEPEIRYRFLELDDTIRRNKFKFKDKEVLLTDRAYYDNLSTSITYWRERFQNTNEPFAANKMKNLGAQRKRFLADCKDDLAREIIKEIGQERFICFCGSVAQARRLGKNVCSSAKSKKDNQELIDKFNNFEINNLFAVDKLKEGTNLESTDYGICVQLGNAEREFIQMLGRTLRSDNPVFYLIWVKNTVDDRFFKNSTKQLQ